MRCVHFLAALVLLLAGSNAIADGNSDTVRDFVAAFSTHDVEAMLALTHPDIEWIYIDGASAQIETSGKQALRDGMKDYFATCPSCRSEVVIGNSSGDFVSALETASWEVNGKRRQQSSVSVYQFENDLIRRVWYFPATG